jgi:peptide/nickel transport system substrate-binding protein
VNYAISRKSMVVQGGAYSGSPWDHILPPGIPGALKRHIYPLSKPNLAKAQQLARGHTRSGKAVYYYFSDSLASRSQMEINRADLARIGITIEERGYRGYALFTAAGHRGADFAIAQAGWCQDYPDPYDFMNILLYGQSIQAENNSNLAYFDTAKYNAKLRAASKLIGGRRYRTYGKLDLDIMKNAAPWAVFGTPNFRFFFSNRVDPKSLVFPPTFGQPSLAAIALK